ncbi:hypothetical protein JCM6882_009000 [Rhodosporidiobolus microsporus]
MTDLVFLLSRTTSLEEFVLYGPVAPPAASLHAIISPQILFPRLRVLDLRSLSPPVRDFLLLHLDLSSLSSVEVPVYQSDSSLIFLERLASAETLTVLTLDGEDSDGFFLEPILSSLVNFVNSFPSLHTLTLNGMRFSPEGLAAEAVRGFLVALPNSLVRLSLPSFSFPGKLASSLLAEFLKDRRSTPLKWMSACDTDPEDFLDVFEVLKVRTDEEKEAEDPEAWNWKVQKSRFH